MVKLIDIFQWLMFLDLLTPNLSCSVWTTLSVAVGDEESDLRRTLQSLAREEGWHQGDDLMGPGCPNQPGPECLAALVFVGVSST